jgi:hypothetical protein
VGVGWMNLVRRCQLWDGVAIMGGGGDSRPDSITRESLCAIYFKNRGVCDRGEIRRAGCNASHGVLLILQPEHRKSFQLAKDREVTLCESHSSILHSKANAAYIVILRRLGATT